MLIEGAAKAIDDAPPNSSIDAPASDDEARAPIQPSPANGASKSPRAGFRSGAEGSWISLACGH